jgi:hypothetical protein
LFGVEGLSLADSVPVTADAIDGVLTWNSGNLSALSGRRIKIRLEIKNAALYSYSFSKN